MYAFRRLQIIGFLQVIWLMISSVAVLGSSKAPGGIAAIFKDGIPVYLRANGYADLKKDLPISQSTRFYFGSDGKKFTAFSILYLEQQGRLKLDDKIIKYIPQLSSLHKDITIDHLLYHTSGIRDYLSLVNIMCKPHDDTYSTPENIFRLINIQSRLNFEPGSFFSYSNSNYFLLALIVEKITARPFHDFVKENILLPAQMNETHFRYMKDVPNTALGYSRKGNGYKADRREYAMHKGDGGIVSTVGDMDKFYRYLFSERNSAILSKMQEPITVMGEKSGYRRAIKFEKLHEVETWYHGGGYHAFTSQMIYIPSLKTSIIVAVNYNQVNALEIAYQLADSMLRTAAPECKSIHSNENKKQFSGWYVDSLRSDFRYFTAEDSLLYLKSSILLEQVKPDRFRSSCVPYITYEFTKDRKMVTRTATPNESSRLFKLEEKPFEIQKEGTYKCFETFGTTAEVELEKGKPVFYFKRRYIARVSFSFDQGCILEAFDAVIRFGRNEQGEEGFWLSNDRVFGLWFRKTGP